MMPLCLRWKRMVFTGPSTPTVRVENGFEYAPNNVETRARTRRVYSKRRCRHSTRWKETFHPSRAKRAVLRGPRRSAARSFATVLDRGFVLRNLAKTHQNCAWCAIRWQLTRTSLVCPENYARTTRGLPERMRCDIRAAIALLRV